MNVSTPEPPPEAPARNAAPAFARPQVAIVTVLFVLNGIVALALALSFSRFYGVSLVCILTTLTLTALSLTLWASHRVLTTAVGPTATSAGWGSLAEILLREWRVVRDGVPGGESVTPAQVFAGTAGLVLLYVGLVIGVSVEGTRSWPKFAPLVDLLVTITGAAVVGRVASDRWVSPRRLASTVRQAWQSLHPDTGRHWIGLALLAAWNLTTTAHGIAVAGPFAVTHDLPLVPVFFVLSLLPAAALTTSLGLLLLPTLAHLDSAPPTTTS